ncbi:hypothetical protein DPMN_090386 [Dreissena polymorpha]|uniref:Uncharacterized protein n=1 Tax=Dreissena polymorpha TaxID=45954 RepID=A0A9D4KXM2_DREPO|nr:hypothetical protein DPMN_090386 [Dreissena polymorpha]
MSNYSCNSSYLVVIERFSIFVWSCAVGEAFSTRVRGEINLSGIVTTNQIHMLPEMCIEPVSPGEKGVYQRLCLPDSQNI